MYGELRWSFLFIQFWRTEKCNIKSLVDKSTFKQTKTVNGLPIISPENLRYISSDASVVLTSAFHADAMLEFLKEIAFAGEVIVFK